MPKVKQYSPSERFKALGVLSDCNMNFAEASKRTGISKSSIVKWYKDEQAKEKSNPLVYDTQIQKLSIEEAEMRNMFLNRIHTPLTALTEKVIARAEALLANCDDVGRVSKLLDVLLKHYESLAGSETAKNDTQISSIRQSIININYAREKQMSQQNSHIEDAEVVEDT